MKILNEVELNEVAKGLLDGAVAKLFDVIADDYGDWILQLRLKFREQTSDKVDIQRTNIKSEFKSKLSVAKGKKYWKIIADNSCWGFIVATSDDKLFKKGDILKSAGWSKPARNAPRGNVLDGNFTGIRWTGPAYLR